MKFALLAIAVVLAAPLSHTQAAELRAGVAKVEITDRSGPVHDPCFVKALVLQSDRTTVALITVDAVAIGELGRIGNGFFAALRTRLQQECSIPPSNVVLHATHCHGIILRDPLEQAVQAVRTAVANLAPVKVGVGTARENRVSENRRLKMKDGSEVDMRRAYSMPRDEDVAGVGPIDPQIGVLRLDRADGRPLAVVYNFACHPIMNPPSAGCSADYPGVASRAIEDTLGEGAMAVFVQGCAGDINPLHYKEVTRPADAEPLGNLLGLAVLRAWKQIDVAPGAELRVSNETLTLPRAADYARRMAAIQAEQTKLVASLRPTNINFKTFLPLLVEQKLSPDFPSHYSQSYLHEKAQGSDALTRFDADNRASVDAYLRNIEIMERLTRLNTNLGLLKMHQAQTTAAGQSTLDAEVCGLRVGAFRLVTFPGELTVQIGLNVKRALGQRPAFVAGYTNGYIYYTPTAAQRNNPGYAQEDCDSLVAPEWQKLFEAKAVEVLMKL